MDSIITEHKPITKNRPSAEPEADNKYCRNCGEKLLGEFCHKCGQEKFDLSHLTLKYSFSHFIDTVFNFEGKFLKTFKALLLKPGKLTNEYISGRIVHYLLPFKLFIFALFVILIIDPTDNTLPESITEDDDPITYNFVNSMTAIKGVSYENFRTSFNEQYNTYFTFLMFGMMFLLALPLKVFFLSSGRFLTEHLIFSAHFFTFVAITLTLDTLIDKWLGIDVLMLILIVQFIYLTIALRKVYNENWLITVGESVLLFIIYFMVLMAGSYSYMALIGYLI